MASLIPEIQEIKLTAVINFLQQGAFMLGYYFSPKLSLLILYSFLFLGAVIHASESDFSPLMKAAQLGKTTEIQQLLKSGESVNSQSGEGVTALHAAVTILHLAANAPFIPLRKDPQIVSILLSNGATTNVQDVRGISPLMIASQLPTQGVAQQLVRNGAFVDLADNKQQTALVYAAKAKRKETIRFLLRNGATQLSGEQALNLRDDEREIYQSVLRTCSDSF